MNAKLSIVLGTYNRLEQLKRCIESIRAQTETSYLLFVSDAGSSDGAVEYLKAIASDRIKPIFEGARKGQARAYNEVFAAVDTPFVCWLSDDNEVVDQGLDLALASLEQ